jgi:hypothetical protein
VSRAVTVFEENSGPITENVACIVGKDTVSEGLSCCVFGGAAEISFASLVAVLKGGREIVIPTPSSAFEEHEHLGRISFPDVVGTWGSIKAESLLVFKDYFLVDEFAVCENNQCCKNQSFEHIKYLFISKLLMVYLSRRRAFY